MKLFLEKFDCFSKPFKSMYQNGIEGFFDKCLNPEQQATNLFQSWIYRFREADYSVFNNMESLMYF